MKLIILVYICVLVTSCKSSGDSNAGIPTEITVNYNGDFLSLTSVDCSAVSGFNYNRSIVSNDDETIIIQEYSFNYTGIAYSTVPSDVCSIPAEEITGNPIMDCRLVNIPSSGCRVIGITDGYMDIIVSVFGSSNDQFLRKIPLNTQYLQEDSDNLKKYPDIDLVMQSGIVNIVFYPWTP